MNNDFNKAWRVGCEPIGGHIIDPDASIPELPKRTQVDPTNPRVQQIYAEAIENMDRLIAG